MSCGSSVLLRELQLGLGGQLQTVSRLQAGHTTFGWAPELTPIGGLSVSGHKKLSCSATTPPSERQQGAMLRLAALRARGIQLSSLGQQHFTRHLPLAFEAASAERPSFGRNWSCFSAAAANESAIVDVLDEPAADNHSSLVHSSSDSSTSTQDALQTVAIAQEHELGPEGHSESSSESSSETPSDTPSELSDLSSETLMGAAEKAAAASTLSKNKPIHPKQNSELELVCESLAYGGAAVCKIPETGYVLMVNGALPGERLLARVLRKKRSMAQAMKIKTLEPPPNLVEPPCKHATDCGGCKTQNWAYESQVAEKQKQVRAKGRVRSLYRQGLGGTSSSSRSFL